VQEPLPEPTPAELAADAQQEAAVFSQAANVDRLYRSCMTLRPKIVKLIDKYSQKRGMLSLRIK
jgi:signal transducing adaptor molecule